jgi:hypothetical protein
MAFIPQIVNKVLDTNSTTTPLLSGTTFTGTYVDVERYSAIVMAVLTDQNGTLFLDFSPDGVNTDSTISWSVSANTNEEHRITITRQYARVRFTNTSNSNQTFIRLQTTAGDFEALTSNLSGSLQTDWDANVTKSVIIGEDPDGNYDNLKADGYGFLTTTPLGSGQTFNSGVLALSPGYSQVQTHVRADQAGTLRVFWYSDSAGTDEIRVLTLPYAATDGFQMFGAPAFAPYIKYTFENTSATGQTDFYFDTKFTTKSINGQVLNLAAPIAAGMVANLGRNVIVGQEPDGSYENVKTDGYAFLTTTPLASGQTYDSGVLALSPGFSQVQTHVRADQAGTLRVFWYSDSAGTDQIRTLSLAYAATDGFQMFGAPAFAPYIKYTFENTSATGQTDFYFDTKFTTKSINGQVLNLTAPIASGMVANLGRNITAGVQPDGTYANTRQDGFAFKTTTPLLSGQTYTSSVFALSPDFSQQQTSILSDTDGILTVYFYSDSAGTDLLRTSMVMYVAGAGLQTFSSPALSPYAKLEFTNTSSLNQTDFYFDTKLLIKPLSGFLLSTNAPVPPEVLANLGRNILLGQDEGFNFRNVGVDEEGHLKVQIDEPLTAFGELQVAEMSPLIQITHPYGINTDLITTGFTTGGTVTYESGNTFVNISTAAATNNTGQLRTVKLAKYRNGQGLNIRFTCLFTSGATGNTQWAGWGDNTNGFFIGYSGTSFGVMRRFQGTDEFIPQTSWNIDKFDGSSTQSSPNPSNPSGVLLDPTKGNVYEIVVQWLGFGAIQFNIESATTGLFSPAHQIKFANQNTSPSLINPTFPISFISQNTTNNTAVSIKNASMAAFVEGIIIYNGVNYSADGSPGATANKSMISLSNPLTFNGVPNKTIALIKTLTLVTDGVSTITFNLVKNGTFSVAPTYTSVSVNSPVQAAIDGTYTAGTGRSAYKTILNKTDSNTIDISNYEIFINPGETVSIIATGGNNTGAQVSLSWLDDV